MTEDKFEHARENAKGWLASIEEMLEELRKADELDGTLADDVRQRIEESVLSVQVRDSWRTPGQLPDINAPEEYEILPTTGGPALRIYGKLNEHCEPESAELQMQDWFLPWTRYDAPEETLLLFAQQFYFGE